MRPVIEPPSLEPAGARLAREVRRVAFPAIVSSLLQTLVFVVDRAMLGHYDEVSLAGMQIAGPLEWSIWSVFSAFTVGTIARVGRHVGARRPDRARLAVWVSLAFALIAGAMVAGLSLVLLERIGWLCPLASPLAVSAAKAYLRLPLLASPIIFLGTAAVAALQAGGDTRTPLFIGVGVNALHIGMNRVLILGAWSVPAMGARGAGISTSVTFALLAALAIAALLRAPDGRAVSLRREADPPPALARKEARVQSEARELARVALPAIAERVLYHAGYLGYVVIIARLGDVAMAANQALISVEAVCFLSADGFGIAAAALVAQKLGADRAGEAERATRLSIRYAAVLLTTLGLVFLALRSAILPIFSGDVAVVAAGAAAVPILALAQPFMATSIVIADALRGGGFTRTVLAVSATSALCVRLSCTWLFAITLNLGLVGVWMGSTADWIVRTLLLVMAGRLCARAARTGAPPRSRRAC